MQVRLTAGDLDVVDVQTALLPAAPEAFPCSCLPGNAAMRWPGVSVVLVVEDVGEHPYSPSMNWPADASRSLCRICRDPHAEELT